MSRASSISEMTLTDNNREVLNLCQINRDANHFDADRVKVEKLEWGKDRAATFVGSPFDVVIATDVL